MSQPAQVKIRNAQLTCDVAVRGAELLSLRDAATHDEFIWQRDPDFWASSAPILFPVIGRFKDGGYLLDSRFYEIPKHGFARDMDFSLIDSTDSSATFRLVNSEATMSSFPFLFELQVTFSLCHRTLSVEYRVVNQNDGLMFFALGSHPAFNLPTSMGPLEDWSIRFNAIEDPVCYRVAANLLSSAPERFEFDVDNGFTLTSDIFARDALIFKGIRSRHLEIVHRTQGVRVHFDTGGAPTLGIWSKPGAPYVCLEPWCGFDDSSEINVDIRQKLDMFRLAAGGTFATGYRITV